MGGAKGFYRKPAGADVAITAQNAFFEPGSDGRLLGMGADSERQGSKHYPRDQLI